ncbi:MAG: hypothetical protein ACI4AM_06320 [Muribaculaceae bacterium]
MIFPATAAAVNISGTWKPGTYDSAKNTYTITTGATYNLTGNVSITGQITIKGNITVTINGNGYSFWNKTETYDTKGIKTALFKVESGATLIIDNVDINGNAHLSWDAANHSTYFDANDEKNTGDGCRVLFDGGIWSEGNLKITNSKIHDFCTYCDYNALQTGTARDAAAVRSATGYGAITVQGGGYTIIDNCKIYDNRSHYGSAIVIRDQTNPNGDANALNNLRINISNTEIYYNYSTNTQGNPWCGIIRTHGSCWGNLTLTNVKIHDNGTAGECAGLYWNGKNMLTLDGCEIYNNYAQMAGGGFRNESTVQFINNVTKIHHNYSAVLGGGIHFYGYAGGSYQEAPVTFVYNLSDKLEVYNNQAPNGAGIAFDFNEKATLVAGSSFITNFNGAKVYNNTATGNGGGIFSSNNTLPAKNYNVVIKLNYGEITGNSATNGGGICVQNSNIEADDNTAGHTLTVSNNSATDNGGGTYLENGTLTLSSAVIQGNTAQSGAGLFVYNSGSSYSSSTFSGGDFIGNTASVAGGGFGAYGKVNITLSDVNITGNSAPCGGGIYLGNGTNLTFRSGIINNNSATDLAKAAITTGYGDIPLTDLAGVGGGIAITNGSTLNFDVSTSFGIYGNTASMAADDIYASGQNTHVYIPKVANMDLANYSMPVESPYWVEDYFNNDTGYSYGSHKNDSGTNIVRYRTALSNLADTYYIMSEPADWPSDTFFAADKYLCLALGYTLQSITIEKHGMRPGDNAIFDITRQGDSTPYLTVVVACPDNSTDGIATKRVVLTEGTWTIAERDAWTWAYTNTTGAITRAVSPTMPTADRTFTFINEYNPTAPPHGESIQENNLTK